MFKYNFIYELKLLIRSQWIQVLSILLLALFSFAVFNGQQKTQKRQADISKVQEDLKTTDENMLKVLDSVEQGLDVSVSRWRLPNNPMTIGNSYPRLAHMPPHHWTFISTGQSDMYGHYVKPTVRGNDFELSFTEMTSPTQLLFGSFDLAFVIVYLLPLIIIAFAFNVLSYERESGSLKLLASQPVSIKVWVLQKLGLRFLWLSVIVLITLSLIFIFNGVNPLEDITVFFSLLGVICAYMLFWFALAFLINISGMNSAKNALSLIGLWILFVLLLPTVVNQVGNTMYPMPSRSIMVNEMRTIKAEATKKQDEILDNYLRDHPEFAINDSTQNRTFWHRYMASQELIKKELQPIINSYDVQLRKQQQWLDQLKWISPAMSVQETLNSMAGTSTVDYDNFRTQAIAFSEEWRAHFIPFLYNNQSFSKEDYKALPQFEYKQNAHSSLGTISILVVMAIILFSIGLFASGNLKHKTILKVS
jgi:ABC-2 type transport system permease protein